MPPRRDRYKERVKQAEEISKTGLIASIPCSYCLSRDRPCLRDTKSRNCAACTRRGQKCERRLHSEKEWDDLRRNREKVAFLIEKTQKQYRESSEKTREALGKLMRLRRHQRSLRERDDRMLEHDQEVLGLEFTEYHDLISPQDLSIWDALAEEHTAALGSDCSENLLNWFDSPSFWDTADLSSADMSPAFTPGNLLGP